MSLLKAHPYQRQNQLTTLLLQIAKTPAPTFSEHARANLMGELWQDLGLATSQDSSGNIIARIHGTKNGQEKPLVLAAHLDTVFGPETPLQFLEQAGRISGPGIGDNAAGLCVLTALAAKLQQQPPTREIIFLATVGEEGLGDLRGAKHFLLEQAKNISAFVAVDGYLGFVVHQALGVSRYRVSFTTAGGHSWGNAGSPSAIQALGEAIHELYKLPIPTEPRSSLNVGTVSGGTSVNSIAAQAELLLDLRSTNCKMLENLEEQAVAALQKVATRSKTELRLSKVGTRPAGKTPNAHLVVAARQALAGLGLETQLSASSTDANAAVPHNLPAISFGVYRGGNAHRTDEWVELSSLETGLKSLESFIQCLHVS